MNTCLRLPRVVFLVSFALAAAVSSATAQGFSWANGLFPWAVFGQSSSSMGGGGTDSWDSRLGPYDPATAGSNSSKW